MDISYQGLKEQWVLLLEKFKQFRDVFRTAKDVYTDLIGIDIDDTSLLAIQLRNPLGIVNVVSAGVIGLRAGAIVEGVLTEKSTLTATVSSLIEKAKFRSKICAIAAVGSKVGIKQYKLDGLLTHEAAEARAWQEAKKTFPELVKNILLDFTQELEVAPDGTKKYVLVVVITRKEDIEPRIDALQQAGLTTKIVDVDYYALERAYHLFSSQLPDKHTEKFVALIHFNPNSIVLAVMHRKSAIYFMRQNYAGESLLPLVQRALGIEITEQKNKPEMTISALSLQLDSEMPVLGKQTPVVRSEGLTVEQKSQAVLSIRRLFQSFYAEQSGRVIDCIAMTGRCALLPELTEYIGKMLDTPTVVVNPLASFKIPEEVSAKRIFAMGPAFAVSCGLAMRGMPLWK